MTLTAHMTQAYDCAASACRHACRPIETVLSLRTTSSSRSHSPIHGNCREGQKEHQWQQMWLISDCSTKINMHPLRIISDSPLQYDEGRLIPHAMETPCYRRRSMVTMICRSHSAADDDTLLTSVSHIIAGSCTHIHSVSCDKISTTSCPFLPFSARLL